MKKFLSLMLAMIMVMSLVTVGAGAAFTDAADIEYTEAVELMTGLKILEGPGDGSFNPKGNLTRGAAAKIIAYIALGATNADEMTYDEVVFPDVPTTSATAPYIAWCAEQGIINGYTDGTFGRKDNVSGHAFLKMVLNAIGQYGEYTGTGWQMRVTSAANKTGIKLLAGIDTDEVLLSEPISREVACQIAFNAMKVDKAYDTGYLVNGVPFDTLTDAASYITLMKLDATPKAYTTEEGTLLKTVHGVEATAATGAIVQNSANADTKLTYVHYAYTVTEEDGTVTTKYKTEPFAFKTGLDQLGNTVKVYYKKVTSNLSTKGHTVISVVDNCKEVEVTYNMTAAELKAALKAAGAKVTANISAPKGAILKADGTVYPGDASTKATVLSGITLIGENATKGSDLVGLNETLTLVVSGTSIVGKKAELPQLLSKVTAVVTDAGKETIKLAGINSNNAIANGKVDTTTEKAQDFVNEYEGIAKNDYVYVTLMGENFYTVEKAETVAGKITKVIDKETEKKVTLGGKEYIFVAGANKCSDTQLKEAVSDLSTIDFTKEYTLYISGDKCFAITGEYVTNPVVYLVATYEKEPTATSGNYGTSDTDSGNTYWAQCVTTAGVEVQYQITEDHKEFLDACLNPEDESDPAVRMFEVATAYDAEDEVTYATFEAEGYILENGEIKSTELKIADGYYYTDTVKFISVKGEYDDLEVVVKEGVQNVKANVLKYYKGTAVSGTANYTVAYVFVDGEFSATAAKATGDIVYAIEADASTEKVPYVDAKGKDAVAYVHTVYIDGVKTEIKTTGTAALNGFIQLTKVVEGVYSTKTYDQINGEDEEVLQVANLIKYGTVDNVYKTKITVTGWDNDAAEEEEITLVDVEAGEAEIVDLRLALEIVEKEEELFTELGKLKNADVALVLDDTTFEVVMIYVIG